MKTIFTNTIKLSDYKPIYFMNGKWYVCFWCKEDMMSGQPVLKGGRYVKSDALIGTGMCTYSYIVYDSKPSVAKIQNDIEEIINDKVSNTIINGFCWNGNAIHLTKENQMNYKANYDLAMQSGGANLPFRIKTDRFGLTEYVVFFTIDELSEFYIAMNKHINNSLETGWAMKDNMDYTVYNV